MGALVLSDPGGEARGAGTKRRYAVPALLVVGWLGLFAYSAAYLTEDMPFRPQAAEAGPSADASPRLRAPGRRVVMLDALDAAAQGSAPEPLAPETPSVQAAPLPTPTAVAAVRPAAAPAPANAEYVGVWGPTADACGAQSRRRGYIPATITQDRARAGRTLCTFHDTHRVGSSWVMAAECSDRGRHWSSQVRLTVDGDHLTWSSSRGTATYIRCSRRAG
jgi:hypothetical protein